MAKITLIGLNDWDSTLFDDMQLPEAMDKEIYVNQILLRGGEFECIYPNPSFCKKAITHWAKAHYKTLEKWSDALAIEYDPLNNYDRTEIWTDTGSHNTTGSGTGSTTGNTSSSASNENKVSAFDSSVYQPHDNNTSSSSGTDSTSSTTSTEENGTTSNTHNGRMFGNIGVTTSQQMLEAELSIAQWNIYEEAADLFLRTFVIPVY